MISLVVNGVERLNRRMERVQRDLRRSFDKALTDAASLVFNDAKTNLSGTVLEVVTGDLRNSVAMDVQRDKHEAHIGLLANKTKGKALIYGPVHEFGMTITAKNGPYLRFPVGARGQHINPETWKGAWATVTSVTIPKRPWLRPALEDNRAKIADLFADEITALLLRE